MAEIRIEKKGVKNSKENEKDLKIPEEIFQDVLEILGSEQESNRFWTLIHSTCLFLTFVLTLRGFFIYDGFLGNVSGFIFGASAAFFTLLILFYQKRSFTIRQVHSQIHLKHQIWTTK